MISAQKLVVGGLVLLGLSMAPTQSLGLEVGDNAPVFSSNSTQGVIDLADFRGKQHVVLALYFAIFTPV